ncbi:MAG: thioredoxin domain-containing protein [Helicobacteraceae bacterium]|jgi:thiol-disulfide isomerase/thioredoxin|nr:thioredoxin domain-containing protein [Helicobacteraceae bacterium]
MKKLLMLGLIALNVVAFAATNKEIEGFYARSLERNPNFTFDRLRVTNREAIKELKGWEKMDVNLSVTPKGQTIPLTQNGLIYAYKGFIAPSLLLIKNDKHKTVSDEKLIEAARANLQSAPNANVSLKSARVIKRYPIKEIEGWEAVSMILDIDVKQGTQTRSMSDNAIWFAGKGAIVPDIIRLETGESLKFEIKGEIKPEHYRADHLIAGNASAANKIIVFSDPLCPACRQTMPVLLKAASENPDKIALYYYAMPTHGVSPTLMKAAIASRLAGVKNAERAMYETDFAVKTNDDTLALKAFNETFGAKHELKDVNAPEVLWHYNVDQQAASELMITSTPSIFLNGKFDSKRQETAKLVNSLEKK